MINSQSKWIRSGVYSLGSRVATLILGFGSFYFLIRHLTKYEFGVWSLFLMVSTIIEMSRNGLVQNALIKLLHASDQADAEKVITASWLINILYSAVVYSILLLGSGFAVKGFNMPELNDMLIYYGVTILILIPLSQFNYLEQSKSSFGGIFWSMLARQGSFFLAVLYIFIFDVRISVVNLVWIQSVAAAVGLCIAYSVTRKIFSFRFLFDRKIVRQVFNFGKYVMGTNITSLFFKNVDQFSIGLFLNASSVALYNSAMRLSNLIEYPATSVAEVVYPHSTAKIRLEGEGVVKSIYEKSVGLTIAITIPIVIFVFVFSDWIILIVAGAEYMESAAILRVVILFGLVIPFNRQYGMTMDSTGRPQYNFALLVAALIINIIFNYLFIRLFGLIGAAYGTLTSYVLICIIGHFMLYRIFSISFLEVFVNMAKYYGKAFGYIKNYLINFKVN